MSKEVHEGRYVTLILIAAAQNAMSRFSHAVIILWMFLTSSGDLRILQICVIVSAKA